MQLHVLKPPWIGAAYCTLHTLYSQNRCSWRRFGTVAPSLTEGYRPCYLCRFNVLEPHRTGANFTTHTLYMLKRCSWSRFIQVEPSRTCVNEIYIPCYLSKNVVRQGYRKECSMLYTLVGWGSTTTNLIEAYILTVIARYRDFHMSSGFDCIEPSPTISLQGNPIVHIARSGIKLHPHSKV